MGSGSTYSFIRGAASNPGTGSTYSFVRGAALTSGAGSVYNFLRGVSVDLKGFRGPQFEAGTFTRSRLTDNQVVLLDTTPQVDLTTTGSTTIHTVSDNRILVLGVVLQLTDVFDLTTQPEVSVGVSPTTDDIFASQELLGFTLVDQTYHFWSNLNTTTIASNTDTIILDVVTAATATYMDAIVRVYGIPF